MLQLQLRSCDHIVVVIRERFDVRRPTRLDRHDQVHLQELVLRVGYRKH